MSTKTALVTTANGNVGGFLVDKLVQLGWTVRAASSRGNGPSLPGVTWVRFDYGDDASMNAASQGVDAVFVNTPPMYPNAPERVNAFLQILRANGSPKVVLMTNILAGHAPDSDHYKMEQALMASGLRFAIVRPQFFMQNFITQNGASIKAEGAFYLPSGDGRVGFVDAADIAAVAARALTDDTLDGRIFHVTGPEPLSHYDVARLITENTGKSVRFVDIPAEAFANGLKAFGLPESAVGFMVFLQDVAVRTNMVNFVTPDVEATLGRPAHDFATFAKANAGAWE